MDVALDANIYLSDPRMEGVAFRSLFDYLRKTDSLLIIPKVIFDEVIARYPERLQPQIKRAINEVASLRNLVIESKIAKIPEIDPTEETRALKRRLAKPSKGVKSKVLRNFGSVSLQEVATRGTRRMPPASTNGEELRDVMAWLMVLAYGKKSHREVALITADKHFRQADGLHSELVKEARTNKINLRFAISIDEFIKAHAPKPTDLTEHEAFGFYGKSHVLDRFEIEVRKFLPSYWRSATSIEVTAREVRFVRGALYEVGPDSKYGEIEFTGELRIRVTTTQTVAQTVQFGVPSLAFSPGQSFLFSPANYGVQPLMAQNWNVNQPAILNNSVTTSAFYGGTGQPFTTTETSSGYTVTGKIILSLRVVSGKLTHVATERLESVEITNFR